MHGGRYSQRSEERRISPSPRKPREEIRGSYREYDERRSPHMYERKREEYTPSGSRSPERRSYDRRPSPRRHEPQIEPFEKHSIERQDSVNRGNPELINSSVASKYSEGPQDPIDETICYLFGLPMDITGDDINDEFAKRQIYKPKRVERINKSTWSSL